MKKFPLFLALFLTNLSFAFAEDFETEVGSVSDFGDFLSQVWSWAAEVIFGVAVLAIVIGGILFMTADGDEQKTDIGKRTIKGAVVSIAIVLFSAVLQKFLQKPTADITKDNLSETSVVITNVINLFLGLVGGLAVLGLAVAGFRHITSGGDEEKLEKAKRGLRLSLLGAGIALAAWSILQFLLKIWK